MQLPLQLLYGPPSLPPPRRAARPRLAEASDRIPLPGIQLRWIQPLLAAPDTAGRFIHRGGDNHCFQSCPRSPPLTARASTSTRSVGQGIRPPTLQRRHANTHFTRHQVDRRTLRRQQPRHYPIFIPLSVSSHFRLPAPPKVPILFKRQLV